MNEQDKQAFQTWWNWSKFKIKADMKELQEDAWQGALEYRDARNYDAIATLELENRMIRERNERLESELAKGHQAEVLRKLAAAAQKIFSEVAGPNKPFSADSYLPHEFVDELADALATYEDQKSKAQEAPSAQRHGQGQPEDPLAYIAHQRFEALLGGCNLTTTLTKHKAFSDDVAIYKHPAPVAIQGLVDAADKVLCGMKAIDPNLIKNSPSFAALDAAITAVEAHQGKGLS